ncbi:MAG: methyltransferase [Planctomycetes bacterium]|nr:methyltransferase [Planctomycetota bacterium]
MKKDLESLLELGWAYWKSQVIFAGVELGVFELLKEKGTESVEIARRLCTDPRATEMLLNALVGLKLLSKKAERYKNTPIASQYLVKGTPVYQGNRIHHLHNLWQRWERLQEAIRTGRSVLDEKEGERPDPQKVRDFMTSMHNYASMKARDLLKRLDVRPFHRLLDLGGGPGTYAIAIAQKNPRLTAVVYDLDHNLEIAREFIKEARLEDRVTTQTGNFLEEDLPGGVFDAVLVSNVLHIYDPPTNVSILRKCHKALQPGGWVIIHEFVLNKSGTGPPFPAFFSLNMLLGTCSGDCYREAEMKEWLSAAGFSRVKTRRLDKDSALITGVRG